MEKQMRHVLLTLAMGLALANGCFATAIAEIMIVESDVCANPESVHLIGSSVVASLSCDVINGGWVGYATGAADASGGVDGGSLHSEMYRTPYPGAPFDNAFAQARVTSSFYAVGYTGLGYLQYSTSFSSVLEHGPNIVIDGVLLQVFPPFSPILAPIDFSKQHTFFVSVTTDGGINTYETLHYNLDAILDADMNPVLGASLIEIPEPSSAWPILAAMGLAAARRKRRSYGPETPSVRKGSSFDASSADNEAI